MSKKESKEERGVKIQWAFVLIAVVLTFVVGLAVNAFYDILRTSLSLSAGKVLFVAIVPALLFIDAFSYFFSNFRKLQNDSDQSTMRLMRMYGVRKRGRSLSQNFLRFFKQ